MADDVVELLKTALALTLRTEADNLDRTADEYERIAGGSDPRVTAIIVFRGMANAKRAAAEALSSVSRGE
jgi:hypothetical protein